jgi:hypothetical protein
MAFKLGAAAIGGFAAKKGVDFYASKKYPPKEELDIPLEKPLGFNKPIPLRGKTVFFQGFRGKAFKMDVSKLPAGGNFVATDPKMAIDYAHTKTVDVASRKLRGEKVEYYLGMFYTEEPLPEEECNSIHAEPDKESDGVTLPGILLRPHEKLKVENMKLTKDNDPSRGTARMLDAWLKK